MPMSLVVLVAAFFGTSCAIGVSRNTGVAANVAFDGSVSPIASFEPEASAELPTLPDNHNARVTRVAGNVAFDGSVSRMPRLEPEASAELPTLPDNDNEQIRVIKNRRTHRRLPRGKRSYPDALQGLVWLDPAGAYGYSNFTVPTSSLAVSLACSSNKFDQYSRVLVVSIAGPCWQYSNNALGYKQFNIARSAGFEYEFTWNARFTSAGIQRCSTTQGEGGKPGTRTCEDPNGFKFTVDVQTPAPEDCPPPEGASQQDVSRCAKLVRHTRKGTIDLVYYGFEIVDKRGKKVEPYYSKFLEYANRQSMPDLQAAAKHNLDNPRLAKPNTSFIARTGKGKGKYRKR